MSDSYAIVVGAGLAQVATGAAWWAMGMESVSPVAVALGGAIVAVLCIAAKFISILQSAKAKGE